MILEFLNEFEIELVSDFQELYTLNIYNVFTDELDVHRVFSLLNGLWAHPWSRFRAKYLEMHPEKLSKSKNDIPSFYGWTPQVTASTRLLERVANLMKRSNSKSWQAKYPWDRKSAYKPKKVRSVRDIDWGRVTRFFS